MYIYVGKHISFTAAGLSIIQDNSNKDSIDRRQYHFGEHGDDVLCLGNI